MECAGRHARGTRGQQTPGGSKWRAGYSFALVAYERPGAVGGATCVRCATCAHRAVRAAFRASIDCRHQRDRLGVAALHRQDYRARRCARVRRLVPAAAHKRPAVRRQVSSVVVGECHRRRAAGGGASGAGGNGTHAPIHAEPRTAHRMSVRVAPVGAEHTLPHRMIVLQRVLRLATRVGLRRRARQVDVQVQQIL